MTATANRYQPRITRDGTGDYYALIVRVDRDGAENVIHGYRGRHFKSYATALRSTDRYIEREGP